MAPPILTTRYRSSSACSDGFLFLGRIALLADAYIREPSEAVTAMPAAAYSAADANQ